MWRKVITTILISLSCWTQAALADPVAVKAATPVQVSIVPESAVAPGTAAAFLVRVSSDIASDNLVVDISLPPGAELLSGDLRWAGGIGPGEVRELRVIARFPADSVPHIAATATIRSTNGAQLAASEEYRQAVAMPSAAKITQGRTVPRNGRTVVEYSLK
ncbi:MAG: hypothetical protein L0Z73_10775 [Gammaproteobacteria bacterium]|nr:hypothetical protein [Gammaproteobacteria bacterium]